VKEQKPVQSSGVLRLDRRLLVALVASGAIHASLAGGLWWSAHRREARPTNRTEPRQPIRVGIDRSLAQTLTWLGFERPSPHEAPLASVEQARFEMGDSHQTPGGEAGAMGEGDPTRARTPSPIQPSRPMVTLGEAQAPEHATLPELDLAAQPALAIAIPGSHAQAIAKGKKSRAHESPAEDNPSASPSDRQSPASSLTRPLRVRPGRPVAMQGLTIRTRVPPEFSIPTSLLAAGRRPVYAVSFGADGTVKMVRIARSSGDPNVDEPGRNALYAWTAEGEALEHLPRGEALDALPPGDPRRFVTVYIELVGA